MYRFAGYVWDAEILQYHCYRRQYDPVLGRFTSRDPVEGDYQEPMSLHKYLYCLNDPINRTDPTGSIPIPDIFTEIANAYNDRNVDISWAVSSGDAWEMAENLTRVQNYYANIVRTRKLADVAFGAIHCVALARVQFFNDVKACGIKDAIFSFINELLDLLPQKLGPIGAAVGTVDTFGCLQQAEKNYWQSIQQCSKVP